MGRYGNCKHLSPSLGYQKSGYSITEIATLFELSVFEKADLSELLTKPEDKSTEIFQNQNIKDQLSLTFNF